MAGFDTFVAERLRRMLTDWVLREYHPAPWRKPKTGKGWNVAKKGRQRKKLTAKAGKRRNRTTVTTTAGQREWTAEDQAAQDKAREDLVAKMTHDRQVLDEARAIQERIDPEPRWTVRGQDALGPDTLEAWAKLAAETGVNPHKIGMAMLDAARMRAWQQRNGCKRPD